MILRSATTARFQRSARGSEARSSVVDGVGVMVIVTMIIADVTVVKAAISGMLASRNGANPQVFVPPAGAGRGAAAAFARGGAAGDPRRGRARVREVPARSGRPQGGGA